MNGIFLNSFHYDSQFDDDSSSSASGGGLLQGGRNLREKKEITSFLDTNGNLQNPDSLKASIEEHIGGINNIFNVTITDKQITVPYENSNTYELENRIIDARVIEIQRKWCLSDLIPFTVFLSAFNTNSIYRLPIRKDNIKDYALKAKPSDLETDVIYRDTDGFILKKYPTSEVATFKQIIGEKLSHDLPLVTTTDDRQGKTAVFIDQFNEYLLEFSFRYKSQMDEGKRELLAASINRRTITIKVPLDLSHQENSPTITLSTDHSVRLASTLSPYKKQTRAQVLNTIIN